MLDVVKRLKETIARTIQNINPNVFIEFSGSCWALLISIILGNCRSNVLISGSQISFFFKSAIKSSTVFIFLFLEYR